MTEDLSESRPDEGRDWTRSAHPERRCTGHRKNGEQCKNAAILGGTVCGYHGGRAPAVRRKAQQRLSDAADRMAKQLLGIAESAESEAVKLAAVKHVLAVAGINEKTSVEVEVEVIAAPWQDIAGDVTGIARISREESHARRGLTEPPRALPAADPNEPVDAELVPDGPQPAPNDHWTPE
ncbi:hypothetical protein [Mycolicibacterium lacusdiani]|uniref:hypothetical protein n=1 Tax=Mycolicibacterium lacusdiani TaxID=2895283 RepID=UPI001F2692A1|nr:hypothetical protein [Mycolicibacterium lacusdiani]